MVSAKPDTTWLAFRVTVIKACIRPMNAPASNVDPAEVRKFDDLASRWWDLDSEFKPLHKINPVRIEYVNQRSPLPGTR